MIKRQHYNFKEIFKILTQSFIYGLQKLWILVLPLTNRLYTLRLLFQILRKLSLTLCLTQVLFEIFTETLVSSTLIDN